MPAPRVPSLWVVLLPAIALAALGARAVVTEARAEEGRVRERTRATAERLVRSLESVVAEYGRVGGSRGAAASADAALEEVRHLFPRQLVDPRGRFPAAGPGPLPSEAADAFVADAFAGASRLGDDDAGREAAAAYLRAAAAAATTPAAREALWLGAASRATPADPSNVGFYDRGAAGAWGLGADARRAALDDVERVLGPALPRDSLDRRAAMDDVLAAGMDALQRDETVVWAKPRTGGLRVGFAVPRVVAMDGAEVVLAVCGEIPASVLEERVGGEARALVGAGGARSVALVAPEGTRSVAAQATTSDGHVLVESVALASPFDGWRVEAVAAAPTGVPGTAVALAAAVVVAAVALVAGTLGLRRTAREQARLAEERQTFLDHVAHEVRTPAAALLALSEELGSGGVAPERAATYHTHLIAEARRLARLVDDTLDLSRLDAGRLVFAATPLDLREVARESAAAAGGGDRVVVRVPDAAVTVRGDDAALRRVVRNLVDNALRHGALRHGALRHGGTEGLASVEVEVGTGDASASLAVRDHGPGIAPEHVARLFERFFRVPSDTHETKGVGLGLALCREVARAHGGDVTVESEVGRGTTFTLRLPLRGGAA